MPRMGRLSLVHTVLLAIAFATPSVAKNASIIANNSQAVEQSAAAANHSIGESNEQGTFCAGGFCAVSDLLSTYTCTPLVTLHPFALTSHSLSVHICLTLCHSVSRSVTQSRCASLHLPHALLLCVCRFFWIIWRIFSGLCVPLTGCLPFLTACHRVL